MVTTGTQTTSPPAAPRDAGAAPPPANQGLTDAEVQARRAAGQGNTAPPSTTRSYREILRQNVFTFINIVLYITSIGLIAMGLYGDALVTAGLVLLNVAIAVFQEARAKRTLDHISLLTRPHVTAIRDGQETPVDASELVIDDVVLVRLGDQIVTDGEVLEGRLDVDESLLTGESEPVAKQTGDQVFSGSFCVTGSGRYVTRVVGAESQANQMTAGARAFRQEKTPLQRDIDLVVRIMVLIVVMIGGPVVIDLAVRVLDVVVRLANESLNSALDHAYSGYSAKETVRAAAVVVAIVPQGLALMIVVTYAAAAIRLIGHKALVQQTNAIESLSHVDLLCLDKTGTLTTNRLTLVELHPIGIGEEEMGRRLGEMAASMSDRNRTADAIATAYPGEKREAADEIAFSSARKWSALAIAQGEAAGCYVLGAPDVLLDSLKTRGDVDSVIEEWAKRGRRVLLLACAPADAALHDDAGEPCLPADLELLGLIALEDELRGEARETLARFAKLGVEPKIISGDDPRTVAALATQAGFPGEIVLVSGQELDELDDEAFAQIARKGTIFGRTTPKHKERLVQTLRDQGRYVAMTGDGVNDVLAMKRANLAISFRSGSPAARGVADLVLLNDSFSALPPAFSEGQRILGGMGDVVGLFLIRSLAVTAIIMGATLAEAPFPLTPKHNSLLAFFALGVPTLALAAWARPRRAGEGLLRVISPFVFTAMLTISPITLAVYLSWWRVTDDMASSQAALTVALVGCGLLLIPFVRPPARFFVTAPDQELDRRVAWLTAALAALFLAVVLIDPLRDMFELAALTVLNLAMIALVLIGWTLLIRWAMRARWFQRTFELG